MDVDNQFSNVSVTALFYIHALQVCHCCLALIVQSFRRWGRQEGYVASCYIVIATKFPHSTLTTLFSNSEITYH